MRTLSKFGLVLIVGAAMLAGGSALAYTTNTWMTTSGDYTNAPNWSAGAAPGATDWVCITNAGSYTVKFTKSVTNGPTVIANTSPTFDMNGQIWKVNENGYGGIVTNTTVKFSSSAVPAVSGGNFVGLGTAAWETDLTGDGGLNNPGLTSITVDDSLGYGVKLYLGGGYTGTRGASIVVSGSGSELQIGFPNGFALGSTVLITNGAMLRGSLYYPNSVGIGSYGSGAATTTVANAGMWTTGVYLGPPYGSGTLILRNSTWIDTTLNGISVGNDAYYDANRFRGDIYMTNSTMWGAARMTIGDYGGNQPSPGRVQIINSTMTLSNNISITPNANIYVRSTLVLNNGTINIGGGASNLRGIITNQGVLYVSGTIAGNTANNALIYNKSQMYVGDTMTTTGMGTLVLSKANLYMDAGSQNYFNFSPDNYDRIVANSGAISALGSNYFSLAAGAVGPIPKIKYGLGVYDFLVGTNVTYTPQYDNLVNLLTNTYHLQYGVDFQYGVVSLGGGLFALELAFVPEPSTILLLGLGGLLVWRRIAKGRRKPGKAMGVVIACGLILALAGGSALAYTSNMWINATTGDYNNGANWSGGAPPASSDWVYFTNSGSYTVQFPASMTNGPAIISNGSPTFDLKGQNWKNTDNGYGVVMTNATVKISSSLAPLGASGNLVQFGSAAWETDAIGDYPLNNPGLTSLTVDDSLGYGVKLFVGGGYGGVHGAQINVSGTNSELQIGWPNGFALGVNVLITNGAVLRGTQIGSALPIGGYGYGASTTQVINASMYTTGVTLGPPYGSGTLILKNSTWNDSGHISVGNDRYYDANPFRGDIFMSNSVFVGQSMRVGDVGGNAPSPGRVQILGGTTATFSNFIWVSSVSNSWAPYVRSTLVLNNGTINLGGGAKGGALTNQSVMQLAGTIRGIGSSPALIRSENGGILDIGASLGTLNLSNANLQLTAGTRTTFEFSNTGLDQISIRGGWAQLLGSNVFSLVAGSPAPTNGVKYGLGTYDFVIGTSVSNAPQYDNLVNLLTNNYHLVYGVDFQYGVVALGGGLFALELAFVPEPSTVLLLALGGLMVCGVRPRKPTAKTVDTNQS